MNIFAVDHDPVIAAQSLCDTHIVSQTKESAQMLSTAHRLLHGKKTKVYDDAKGKIMNRWVLPDDLDSIYHVAHPSHPCTLWTMQSKENYEWHYNHFFALANEFKFRYDKDHASFTKLGLLLKNVPVCRSTGLTPFALAMKSNPECMFNNDPIMSYQAFYKTKKDRFKMEWRKREVPQWFSTI
jgi:hypothetical protein